MSDSTVVARAIATTALVAVTDPEDDAAATSPLVVAPTGPVSGDCPTSTVGALWGTVVAVVDVVKVLLGTKTLI